MKLVKLALLFAVFAAMSHDANAQVDVSVGVGVDVDVPTVVVEPPAAYIATVEPEYYEGRPVYYYNNYWYYRDHGRWSYYRSEPMWLRERRGHWVDRGYVRSGYVRGGYRGGYAHPGGYVRGGGYVRAGGYVGGMRGQPARYHYHR